MLKNRLTIAVCVMVLTGTVACSRAASTTTPGTGSGLRPVATAGPFASVSGDFGDNPGLTFPEGGPPSVLQRKVLRPGTGAVLAVGDLVVADYLGQVWHGDIFDSSYSLHSAAAFGIGIHKVIPGWDTGLVGLRVGTRVELVVPPSAGFAATDLPDAVKATDTLVYVIDIAQTYNQSSVARDAIPAPLPPGGPVVTGPLGSPPVVRIPAASPPPQTRRSVVLARGRGPVVKPGAVVVEYSAVGWDGASVASTWQNGLPTEIEAGIDHARTDGVYDSLVGVPLGSRVLIETPAAAGQDRRTGSLAIMLDLIAQPTTAAATR